MAFDPIVLAPAEEVAEVYPYRRVWRTSWAEALILFGVVSVVVVLDLFGLLARETRSPALKIGLALVPLIAWLAFSYLGERRALQPRRHLPSVLLLGALVANGVAIPLEQQVFEPDRWLPTVGFFGRVLGYMMTMGFVGEFLKYAVLRYAVWPGSFRQRLDGIAYAVAVSLGYALVFNLRVALDADMTVYATALRVASITFSQVGIGVIMGFFLAELRIGQTPIFWLPIGLGLSALISGLYFSFRAVAIVSGLSEVGTGSSPLRGLALGFGLVAVIYVVMAFIIENADARMEMALGRRGVP